MTTETAGSRVRVQVRLGHAVSAWLEDRAARMGTGNRHQQARAELELWRAALAAELRRIRLTEAQLTCIADVLGGGLSRPAISIGIGTVYAQCYDAFRLAGDRVSSYGAKHGIDEQPLLDYLGSLGPAADHALADAVSRWWAADLDGSAEGFATVGLRQWRAPGSARPPRVGG